MTKDKNFRYFAKNRRKKNFEEAIRDFSTFIAQTIEAKRNCYRRRALTPMDREVWIATDFQNYSQKMLMFGSNNYLGLANHPYIQQRVKESVQKYGAGIGGTPLLNGSTQLLRELEKRLAHLKGKEDALVYSSGYATNLGLFSTLPGPRDLVLVDASHHASCFDGLEFGRANYQTFAHNQTDALHQLLVDSALQNIQDRFIAVEGVYSMRGDVAPLNTIVSLAKKFGCYVIIDDAHSTGVLGPHGAGTAQHLGVTQDIDIIMGTFSKVFAVTGGFVAANADVITYLRYFSRPYVFSGNLTSAQISAVLAGIDLLEKDETLVKKLWENINYTQKKMTQRGFDTQGNSAIFTIRVPDHMDVRDVAYRFHTQGIFVNPIEYPALPLHMESIRMSVIASHTLKDIDRFFEVLDNIWTNPTHQTPLITHTILESPSHITPTL